MDSTKRISCSLSAAFSDFKRLSEFKPIFCSPGNNFLSHVNCDNRNNKKVTLVDFVPRGVTREDLTIQFDTE